MWSAHLTVILMGLNSCNEFTGQMMSNTHMLRYSSLEEHCVVLDVLYQCYQWQSIKLKN